MFNNVGRKIKNIAGLICGLGIVASFIAAMIVAVIISNLGAGITVLVFFLIIIAGIIVSWLSSIFIYGFGELIEKTTEVAENTKSLKTSEGSTDVKEKLEILEKCKEKGLIYEDEYLEKKNMING